MNRFCILIVLSVVELSQVLADFFFFLGGGGGGGVVFPFVRVVFLLSQALADFFGGGLASLLNVCWVAIFFLNRLINVAEQSQALADLYAA